MSDRQDFEQLARLSGSYIPGRIKRFEYRCVKYDTKSDQILFPDKTSISLASFLGIEGEEGWELCTNLPCEAVGWQHTLILKREIKDL